MSLKAKVLLTVLLCNCVSLFAQKHIWITGFVKDSITNEVLAGAAVYDSRTNTGLSTDNQGFFRIKVSVSSSLIVSYVGYKKRTAEMLALKDTLVHIFLSPQNDIEGVTIVATRKTGFNIASLSTKEFIQLPTISGKPDVGKGIQLLPGINMPKDGSSVIMVRGGDPGQNLYLFDNVPVIYVNHLGGFTSVFNPDIINSIDLFKGGFPARYGGKLSSIIDITQKEGNISQRKGVLSLGLTDVSFAVDGPIKKWNASYVITGRKTLIDPIMALLSRYSEGNDFIVAYGFHDINSKVTWKPSTNASYSLNIYYGDDYLNYWKKSTSQQKHRQSNVWGNFLISAQSKYVWTPRLYSFTSISYTRYRLKDKEVYSLSDESSTFRNKKTSSVEDFLFQSIFKYDVSRMLRNEIGFQSSIKFYQPTGSSNNSSGLSQSGRIITSNENILFAESKIVPINKFTVTLGLRATHYSSESFSNFALEPRVNLNLDFNQFHTISLSYMHTNQYSHLVMTGGSIMLNEVWFPSGNFIAPASTKQYTLGWKGYFVNSTFLCELNLFYKEMKNLITYKEGFSSVLGDSFWQSKIERFGKGSSSGLEFLIKKTQGKLTGFIGYTYSNTTRQFLGINNGIEFPFEFDRPHSLSVSANYSITPKLQFNVLWTFQSGLPYTPAIGKHYIPTDEKDEEGNNVYVEALVYGAKNGARMSYYHRLDVGLSYETITKRKRKAVWSFSVFNLYNRRNAYSYYYNHNDSPELYIPDANTPTQPLKLYQISYFPIIPTFSYRIYFDTPVAKENRAKFKNWIYHED